MCVRRLVAGVAVMLVMPVGWAGGCGETVAVSSVYSAGDCLHRDAPGAVRLDGPAELAAFTDGAVAAEPDSGQRLLLGVSMGLQPTPGYSVRLAATKAPVNDGTVSVPIEWRRPPAGAIQPHVVSWPCLVVSLARAGDYRAIRFVDRNGDVRARLGTAQR